MLGQMMDFPLTIPSVLEHGFRVFPRKEIVSYLPDKSVHRYTYSDLYSRSKKLMYALVVNLGIKKGDMVATFAWNHYQHMELYFGIPGAGAVCHTVNIRLSQQQTEFIINNAEDRFVFVDASLVPLLEPIANLLSTVEQFFVINVTPGFTTTLTNWMDYEDLIRDCPDDYPWIQVDEKEASGMCYTSGTTGMPKGALYSHRSTCLHSMTVALPNIANISSADRVLVVVPQFHVMAWGMPYAAVMCGAVLVLPSSLLQPEPLIEMILAEKVNKASGVPTIWHGVYSLLKQRGIRDFPIKEFLVGGAAAPPSMIENFQKDFGIKMVHAWGMTETSPVGTLSRLHPEHDHLSDAEKIRLRSTQGQVLPFTEIRIVMENGEVAPRDGKTIGEIHIRGAWIISSYYKTQNMDSFSEDGWLKTGDVGTINADGYLQITDRAKDLIKSGGEWISSVALEVSLMAHPKIKEASVIAIPDDKWSERPLALVVLKDEKDPIGPDDLKEFLAGSFAKYQIPDKFVFPKEIPKTSVGKFDKKKMRQWYAEGQL
jgi:fatty-acyl-CoA synthase